MTSSHTKPRRRRLWPWSRHDGDRPAATPTPSLPRLPEGAVLAARGLRLTPGGEGPEARAPGIDLDIMRDAFTAIMVPTGSGASMFLRVLAGLRPAAGGSVLLDGQDLATPGGPARTPADPAQPASGGPARTEPHRARVGLLFADPGLVPTLTVRQNILLAASIAGRPVTRERLEAVAAAADLQDILDRRPGELSGGRRQHVAVARAVITGPAVVLADEPTGGPDPASAEELLRLLRVVVSDMGCPVVMATRDAAAAARADRVLLLADDRVVGDLPSPTREDVLAALAAREEAPDDRLRHVDGTVPTGGDVPADRVRRSWRIPEAAGRGSGSLPPDAAPPTLIPRLPAANDGRPAGLAGGTDVEPTDAPAAANAVHPRVDRPPAVQEAWERTADDDPRTQEIALLAAEQVRAIDQAAARSAASHDALREELGAEAVQASLNRLSPTRDLPEDSARVVDQAQRILGDLPGPIMPED